MSNSVDPALATTHVDSRCKLLECPFVCRLVEEVGGRRVLTRLYEHHALGGEHLWLVEHAHEIGAEPHKGSVPLSLRRRRYGVRQPTETRDLELDDGA